MKAETLQDRIEVNKLDIALPHRDLHKADAKKETGWKARRDKLGAKRSLASRGLRYGKDNP